MDIVDIGYDVIGWLNVVSVLLMTPVISKTIKDYDRQRAAGVDPVFDPYALDSSGADYCVKKSAVRQAELVESTR